MLCQKEKNPKQPPLTPQIVHGDGPATPEGTAWVVLHCPCGEKLLVNNSSTDSIRLEWLTDTLLVQEK
ncbi:hypothetical protein EK904_006260 [Melospiza melodia maxima]|nr:hypothetical protein EK904_006260 [Melospiza melodia maxima]